jgi:hypothetical protein
MKKILIALLAFVASQSLIRAATVVATKYSGDSSLLKQSSGTDLSAVTMPESERLPNVMLSGDNPQTTEMYAFTSSTSVPFTLSLGAGVNAPTSLNVGGNATITNTYNAGTTFYLQIYTTDPNIIVSVSGTWTDTTTNSTTDLGTLVVDGSVGPGSTVQGYSFTGISPVDGNLLTGTVKFGSRSGTLTTTDAEMDLGQQALIVPEPGTSTMAIMGGIALLLIRRRRFTRLRV